MDTALISASSALAGSVLGGLSSGITTWLSLRSQLRAGQRAHAVSKREELYREFITAASAVYGSAVVNSDPKIEEMVVLYGMVSRMRVLCSPQLVACAEKVNDVIIDVYLGPNKTFHEIHALMKNGQRMDPLREFSEMAREELRVFSGV